MIEINLPKEAAVSMLNDQVQQEIEERKEFGELHPEDSIETITALKLRAIVEAAVFDIIALLPVTIITEKSNLPKIIVSSVHGFARLHKRTDLSRFTEKSAKNILKRAYLPFKTFGSTTTFQNN